MDILLVGRTPTVIEEVLRSLNVPEATFHAAGGVDDVSRILAEKAIDHVILGGGLDLQTRLEIVRRVFTASDSTRVYMNSPSGPDSYLPFVRSVLYGLVEPA